MAGICDNDRIKLGTVSLLKVEFRKARPHSCPNVSLALSMALRITPNGKLCVYDREGRSKNLGLGPLLFGNEDGYGISMNLRRALGTWLLMFECFMYVYLGDMS